MRFRQLILMAAVLNFAGLANAQEWAKKMFDSLGHDFGTVVRGAKAEYKFEITNLYKEDVHIVSVESSCGCTTPQISKQTLKTFEKADILAVFNTRAFLGAKNAVLTVRIDQPFPAEVQLRIDGYIRSDVVLHPGSVELGTVAQGSPAEKHIEILYAGRTDWQIVDVRTTNAYLEAELAEKKRGAGEVAYDLLVRVRGDAPVGYINEQLTVVTNDQRLKTFPVDVSGKIESDITVSPSPLFFTPLAPGNSTTKQLVVRGKKPFKITKVHCQGGDCFDVQFSEDSKVLHLIPVTFTATQAGKFNGKIAIETDLGPGVVPNVEIQASCVEP